MKQKFGAGIWHFATYVDRYATDGYGEPRSVLDAISLAGKVRDLSVVDINFRAKPWTQYWEKMVKATYVSNAASVRAFLKEMFATIAALHGCYPSPVASACCW